VRGFKRWWVWCVFLVVLGCQGRGGVTAGPQQSAAEQCRGVLREIVETGVLDSGVALLIEQAEKVVGENPSKQPLVQAVNELQATRGKKAIQKKAEEILGLL
jgi:hypothetical protein